MISGRNSQILNPRGLSANLIINPSLDLPRPPGKDFLPEPAGLATHFAPRRALVRAENHRQVEVADGTNLGKNRPSNERSEYRSREA